MSYVIWRAIIWYAERTTPFTGALLPTCGAIVSDEYAQAVERARSHIQAMMSERQIPGLSVCVAVDGKPVWNERLSIAIVTNLGHAKLPFARSMGVVNPLLGVAS